MENIRTKLGRRVRDLRTRQRWSQDKLGEQANLHPTYIGGIERGERNVSLLNLAKLSEAFHMTLAELLHFSEKDHNDKAIQVLIAGEDELALAFYAAFCQKCQSLKRFRELKALAPPPNGPPSRSA